MDIRQQICDYYFANNPTWNQLYDYAAKYDVGTTARTWVRRDPRYKEPKQEQDIQQSIIKDLAKEQTAEGLCNKYKISQRILTAVLEEIKDSGFLIMTTGNTLKICRDLQPQENILTTEWAGDRIIRFGLCGDNQAGSKYTQWTHIHAYYDLMRREGITTVYHTGDITEGEEMRLGHKYECYTNGADELREDIIKNYPSGIDTYFITGNHDHSIIKRAGYDIGVAIASGRKDLIYLGQSNAIINLTPNCRLELTHPIDGSAYALSYKPQKMIDALQGGQKSNILAIGHYHKAEYIFYRNIHTFQTGCFQAQTPFMRGKQLAAHVGGWIVELHVDEDGTITRCKGEFIPYYKMTRDDYLSWR